jgi:hypothetical protein
MIHWVLRAAIAAALLSASFSSASAHDIYTRLKGKDGLLCCGGSDCAATTYRERGGEFEFLTREQRWVAIPEDRITFLPVPGDPPSDDTHRAHLCYRQALPADKVGWSASNVFDDIYLFCAFIPPGAT